MVALPIFIIIRFMNLKKNIIIMSISTNINRSYFFHHLGPYMVAYDLCHHQGKISRRWGSPFTLVDLSFSSHIELYRPTGVLAGPLLSPFPICCEPLFIMTMLGLGS